MKRLLILTVWILVSGMIGGAVAAPGTLLLNVQTPPLAWGDPQVYEKLETLLTQEGRFDVVRADGNDRRHPDFPNNRNNVDSMVNWGQEAGGRFLMVVTVASERLERKKSFSLPLIFHKWETVGIIEGEMRLFDVARGKLLVSEPFEIELKGSRAFQASPDDDRNDPTIHITAVEKLTFFGRLEDKLAERLAKSAERVLRNR